MSKQSVEERLARIEAHLEYIKDNMSHKGSLNILKWSLGGVATLALSALLMAAKAINV